MNAGRERARYQATKELAPEGLDGSPTLAGIVDRPLPAFGVVEGVEVALMASERTFDEAGLAEDAGSPPCSVSRVSPPAASALAELPSRMVTFTPGRLQPVPRGLGALSVLTAAGHHRRSRLGEVMGPPLQDPTASEAERPAPRGPFTILLRIAVGLALLATAAGLLWANHAFRSVELVIAGAVMSFGTGGHAVISKPTDTVFIHTESSVVGLQIAASCTAAFLLVPFLALAAAMMGSRRLLVHRVLLGLVCGTMLVFWLNEFRFFVIAWATHHWGLATGFEWSHVLAGTVITTLAMLMALFVFARVSLAGGRQRRGPIPASS